MDNLIEYLKGAGVTSQALAVSAGGLIGVFVTLAFFYLVITLVNRLGRKERG